MPTDTPTSLDLIPAPDLQTPTPASGYANVRLNALKHGILSRHVVLAHEDGLEFDELLATMMAEHQPSGPTETHLVEELAATVWRKRRALLAEGASINRGLLNVSKARNARPFDPDGPARAALPFEPQLAGTRLNQPAELAELVRLTPEEARSRALETDADLAATLRAIGILRRGGARAYTQALRALSPSSLDSWNDALGEGEVEATAEDLMKHVHEFLLPYCQQAAIEARSHDAIKAQTLGEGLQAQRLESLNRYETHLDRKFERTLAMLLKLKELRRAP